MFRQFRKKIGKAAQEQGITLLLVVAILSSLLSISLGIFNIIFGQIRISGEIADSFVSFYAADQGIEKILYRDRQLKEICPVPSMSCYTETGSAAFSGGCYDITVNKVGVDTQIKVLGQYRCGTNPSRVVKRGFDVTY